MANSVIGALRVMLGMDTAEFEKGSTRAQREAQRMERKFQAVGKRMQKIGVGMSAAITAPIVGAAAAFASSANQIAAESREIATAAQVAGEGFEDFQRHAFAAKTVGIEFDKLGDIFKDVRDRVGDFVATGGGPMADFFENIAPKVGITAEAFKGLSGRDALQLYYNSLKDANVSQEEMVFYLEAMASDTTALIPLLEKNGKAMGELGKNANIITDDQRVDLEKYTAAQDKLGQSVQKLTIALVESGVLEAVTEMIEGFARFTSELAETNPDLLKAGMVFAGLAAAIGPVLIVLGQLVAVAPQLAAAFGVIKGAALLLMGNPVILGFAAVVTGIYLAWQNWDKIAPYIDAVGRAVSEFWSAYVEPALTAVKDAVFGSIKAWLQMHVEIGRALMQAGASVWEWASGVVRDMVQVGRDIIEGIVRGIKAAPGAVWNALQNVVGYGVDQMKSFLGIQSPSLLFMGIGKFMTEGLAIGVERELPRFETAMDQVALASERGGQRVQDSFLEMTEGALSQIDRLLGAIKGGNVGGILQGLLGIGKSFGLFGGGSTGTLPAGGILGGGQGPVFDFRIPGFNKGGAMQLGGFGGIDRNILSLNGSPIARVSRGETMAIRPANDSTRDVRVTIVDTTGLFETRVEGAAARVVAQASGPIARQGAAEALGRLRQTNRSRLA